MTTAIEVLRERILERFPDAVAHLDRPTDPEGGWWLDVAVRERELNIEWRRAWGFGVNGRPDAVLGERNDELYATLDEAFARVDELIRTGVHTDGFAEVSRPGGGATEPTQFPGSASVPRGGRTNAA